MTHEPAPLVFLDTEATGLRLDDDIWEFAAIRREPDGTETTLHLFIEHDWEKCARLPDTFKADHLARFPGHDQHTSRRNAAHQILRFLAAGDTAAHIVGAVPNFDTERISLLLRTEIGQHVPDPWHYHLIDVENLAVGALAATPIRVAAGIGPLDNPRAEVLSALMRTGFITTESPLIEVQALRPPWNSDELSRALGIDPDATGPRHTALADARWAMAIYDRVMGGSTS